MSLGDDNRNPGNLKAGPFTRMCGQVGRDRQGHAIFPDYSYGLRALELLLLRKARGQTLAEVGAWYAEDPRWASNVARAMGVDVGFAPDLLNALVLRKVVKAIHVAEGTQYRGL